MPLLRTLVLSLALAPLALAACTDNNGGDEAGPDVDCAAEAAPKYSEMAEIWAQCTICHSSMLSGADRKGAPDGYDYDTYESAKAEAAEIAEEVDEGKMPLPPGMLTAEQKDQLVRWAACGTPP